MVMATMVQVGGFVSHKRRHHEQDTHQPHHGQSRPRATRLDQTPRRHLANSTPRRQMANARHHREALMTRTATVTLFTPDGKYYISEAWRVPEGAIGPYDMINSPDFRRINDGPVLVETNADPYSDTSENWGYPHLFPADRSKLYSYTDLARAYDEGAEYAYEDAAAYYAGDDW